MSRFKHGNEIIQHEVRVHSQIMSLNDVQTIKDISIPNAKYDHIYWSAHFSGFATIRITIKVIYI